MTSISPKLFNIENFILEYKDNPRYELADGELIEMEPTGPHETVDGKLATQIGIHLVAEKLPWFIPRTCLIQPLADALTIRRPDVVVLDETLLCNEPLWEREPVITLGSTIKLVVEVVSDNWETDYARKVEEYSLLGIQEYWIADYRGLGGIAFIGKPKQPTFTVCQLVEDTYIQKQYRLNQLIESPIFPSIQLRLNDVLPR
ncbi:MAG: Uma2 family endonuclease [Cyanobacteria bacterium J06635_10]